MVSTRPGRARRGRVGVPGLVNRPHFEGMRAVGKRRSRPAGVVQVAKAAPSRRHWKDATPEPPVSVPEKVKLAEALFAQGRRARADRGVRRGGVDRPGRARRGRVDVPGLVDRPHFEGMRAVGERRNRPAGVVQAAKAAPSRRHWKRRHARAAGVGAGEGEAGRGAPVNTGGPEPIEVVGAAVSTVQVEFAGVASTFPAWSIARTSKLCEPSASPE